MTQLGLHRQPHSQFLPDPAAQVVTSVRGRKRTFTKEHLQEVAWLRADGVWEPYQPGKTLHGLGNRRAASNFSFRSGKLVRPLADIVGFGAERADALYAPISLPKTQTPQDQQRDTESREKLKAWFRINAAFDDVVRQLEHRT